MATMRIFTSIEDPDFIDLVTRGAVGVMLTDTIYGLVAAANNPHAAEKLYALKHRERKPGTVIAGSIDQLTVLGVGPAQLAHVADLWPNPFSVEMDISDSLAHLHQGTGHCAFRVVSDPRIAALLLRTGPLLTSSANPPGEEPANTIAAAQAYFGDSVDFYVDGGEVINKKPSTVARLNDDGSFELRRQGAVVIPANRLS